MSTAADFEFLEDIHSAILSFHEILEKGFIMSVEDKYLDFVCRALTDHSYIDLLRMHDALIKKLSETEDDVVQNDSLLYYKLSDDHLVTSLQLIVTRDVNEDKILHLSGCMEEIDYDGAQNFGHWDCIIPIVHNGTSTKIKFTVEECYTLPIFMLDNIISSIFYIMSRNWHSASFLSCLN